MKFQQFMEQGYLILKQDSLKALVEPSELEIFHHNILSFRSAMRSFFEKPERERQLFESGDYVFRSTGYRATGLKEPTKMYMRIKNFLLNTSILKTYIQLTEIAFSYLRIT
ncbi:MAG: hypothetical protein WBA93_21820 [Microcoleaceae cyanobacterium]